MHMEGSSIVSIADRTIAQQTRGVRRLAPRKKAHRFTPHEASHVHEVARTSLFSPASTHRTHPAAPHDNLRRCVALDALERIEHRVELLRQANLRTKIGP